MNKEEVIMTKHEKVLINVAIKKWATKEEEEEEEKKNSHMVEV